MAVDIMSCYTTKPPVREYVLPGLIAGVAGSIVSPGGQGKSMLSLMLAHCIAGGVDLLGLGQLKSGPVAYLSAEDGGDVLHERLHAIGAHMSAEQRQACADGLLIVDLTQHTPDLLNGTNAPEWRDFVERAAACRRLLLLDTLRSVHSGDENDGTDMAVLVGHLRAIAARTGCALVFLHHASKAAAMSGQGDVQQASRGSSVLTDNIRWQSYLAGMTAEEAKKLGIEHDRKGFYVRFGVSKQNYGAPLPERWFERKEGGVLVPVELLHQVSTKGGRKNEGY